jgi:hypothetical protein
MLRMSSRQRLRGSATERIILSAVGGRNALRIPKSSMSWNAASGSNFAKRCDTTVMPWCQAGIRTSYSWCRTYR